MPLILTGEGLKYHRQQRRTIVISNASDGNPIKKGLLLSLIAHLDMRNEAPGQNTDEESRTKKGLHCFKDKRKRRESHQRNMSWHRLKVEGTESKS